MALAEVFPSGDGEVAAGAEAESPRIVELLKERRGGKSLPFGDSQLAAVAEEMVSDGMSAAMLRENALGDASMVDAVSPYFATARYVARALCGNLGRFVAGLGDIYHAKSDM